MKSSPAKTAKKDRATVWTDCARVLLCGIGYVGVCLVVIGFFNEDHDYPIAGLLIGGIIALAFIAVGLFAKPRIVEKVVDGVKFW